MCHKSPKKLHGGVRADDRPYRAEALIKLVDHAHKPLRFTTTKQQTAQKLTQKQEYANSAPSYDLMLLQVLLL